MLRRGIFPPFKCSVELPARPCSVRSGGATRQGCACPEGYRRVGKRCLPSPKPRCSPSVAALRWPDTPTRTLPEVTDVGACCDACRAAAAGCRRYHVSADGCALFSTHARGTPVRAAGFTMGTRLA